MPISDQRAEAVATALINEWSSVFGPIQWLLSDGGPSLVGKVVILLTNMLGIGRMQACPLHPQSNRTVERWNHTMAKDLATVMNTGYSDWDEYVALGCFRYNTGVCHATGMTPYKAMFGADDFEVWRAVM